MVEEKPQGLTLESLDAEIKGIKDALGKLVKTESAVSPDAVRLEKCKAALVACYKKIYPKVKVESMDVDQLITLGSLVDQIDLSPAPVSKGVEPAPAGSVKPKHVTFVGGN